MSLKQSLKNTLARLMVMRSRSHDEDINIMEQKHVDLSLPFPNDSSFFYGGDKDGNAFICRMALRDPARGNEAWFDFHLNDFGYVGLQGLPGEEGEGFSLGNLKWEPLIIGSEWLISYNGPLSDKKGTTYNSRVELVFRGNRPCYDFADTSDKGSIALAMAAEPWTGDYFRKLKELSQVHYEQMGTMDGFLELDGKRYEFNFSAIRDHSYGSRDWRQWDRHYWMSGIADDGHCFTVTTIRYDFIGRLTAGFIIEPDGTVDAITQCTGLDEISSKELWPDNGTVTMSTRKGRELSLKFTRKGHFPYLMDDSYHMLEGIGSYSFNGSPALGMIEFGFNSNIYTIGSEPK